MNTEQLFTQLTSNIHDLSIVVYNRITVVARDKQLRCVPSCQVLKTDIPIAAVTQYDACKSLDSPFWQNIMNKISQLQQKGKLCQKPPQH